MKRLQLVAKFYLFFSLLAGCQGETPEIKYTGISTQSAIDLVLSANSKPELLSTVERIHTDRQQTFDWVDFWTQIRESGHFSQWTPPMQESLLSLFLLECSQEGVLAKARLIKDSPHYYSQLFGANTSCRYLLNSALFSHYMELLLRPLREGNIIENQHDVVTVDILHQHFQSWGMNSVMVEALASVQVSVWQDFLVGLIEKNDPESTANFIVLYNGLLGNSQLAQFLIPALVERPGFLPRFVQVLDYYFSLDLLAATISKSEQLTNINQEDWYQLLEYIVENWAKRSWSLGSTDFRQDPIPALGKIFSLFNQAQHQIELLELLQWIDQITLELRSQIQASVISQDANLSDNRLATLWIQKNIMGSLPSTAQGLSRDGVVNSQLDRVLMSRLKIDMSEAGRLHQGQAINDFCQLLEQAGLSEKEIVPSNFNSELLSQPGCVSLGHLPMDHPALNMRLSSPPSFFSVLRTHGTSIEIEGLVKADQLVIDGSATRSHPQPAIELPLADDHALVIPVSFGFRLLEDTYLLDAGTYYLPFHYIHRKAKDGRPAQHQPLQGLPGGHISFISDYEPTPLMISLGGAGQSPVPPRQGGNGDVSSISWARFDRELRLSSSVGLIRSLIRPTIGTLDHILEHAELDTDGRSIRIFTSTQAWLSSLEPDQQDKLSTFCAHQELSITSCYHQVTLLAAQQLSELLDQALSENSSSYILPQLASEEFTLPGGEQGPLNSEGRSGEPGVVSIGGRRP
jgi:hypothetical protein